MSKKLSVFNFHSKKVRVELLNHTPYFCLKDIAHILNITNTKSSRFKLDTKGIHKIYLPTNGGNQEIVFISEANLYRVIFRSNKDEAIQFQNWVFDEVLPTIRATGKYEIPQHLTPAQQQHIQTRITELANVIGNSHRTVHNAIKTKFKVDEYQNVPSNQYPELCKFLECKPLLENEYLNLNIEKTTIHKSYLNNLIHHMIWLKEFYYANHLYQIFQMLGSDLGSNMHAHIQEGYIAATYLKQYLN